MNIRNLFNNVAPTATGERSDVLLEHMNLVIERICSSADIPLTQYVQTQDEWVLLVQGIAEIEIDGKTDSLGRRVPGAPPLHPAAVRPVGRMTPDKQAGAFQLLVRTIKAVDHV